MLLHGMTKLFLLNHEIDSLRILFYDEMNVMSIKM